MQQEWHRGKLRPKPSDTGLMMQCNCAAAGTATAVKCELAGEVLRKFGSLQVPAIGWSMLPTVRPGDTLVVERIAPDQVRAGDVVVTGRGGTLVGHRVVSLPGGLADRRWITQGDALALPDQPVRENE